MKYFQGSWSVPYQIFLGYKDLGVPKSGTVEVDAIVVAKTKKRAVELSGATTYWFGRTWKEIEKPDLIPEGEGCWWTPNNKLVPPFKAVDYDMLKRYNGNL